MNTNRQFRIFMHFLAWLGIILGVLSLTASGYVWYTDMVERPEFTMWQVVIISTIICATALTCAYEEVIRLEGKGE